MMWLANKINIISYITMNYNNLLIYIITNIQRGKQPFSRRHKEFIGASNQIDVKKTTAPPAIIGLLMVSLLTTGSAIAAEQQTLDSLYEAVHTHITALHNPANGRLEIQIKPLDNRLRLGLCAQALDTHTASGNDQYGHVTVGVACPGSKPWKIYVPAKISLYTDVAISTQHLPRGHQVVSGDITFVNKDLSTLINGFYSDKSLVIGNLIKHPIKKGDAFTPAALKKPKLIRRGELVSIISGRDGFSIRIKGKALSDGAHNETIPVKNLSSNKIITGRVIKPGVVRVML